EPRPRRREEYGRQGAQDPRDPARARPAVLLADVSTGALGSHRRGRLLHQRGLDAARARDLLQGTATPRPALAAARADRVVSEYSAGRSQPTLSRTPPDAALCYEMPARDLCLELCPRQPTTCPTPPSASQQRNEKPLGNSLTYRGAACCRPSLKGRSSTWLS